MQGWPEFSLLPLTKVERDNILKRFALPGIWGGWNFERYDSTVRKLEWDLSVVTKALVAVTKELSAVTKERNKYSYIAGRFLPDDCPGRDQLAEATQAQWDRQGFIS